MNEEYVAQLERMRYERRELKIQEIAKSEEIRKLATQCDHLKPDGSSALNRNTISEDGDAVCTICSQWVERPAI